MSVILCTGMLKNPNRCVHTASLMDFSWLRSHNPVSRELFLTFAALETGREMAISELLDANIWCLVSCTESVKSEVSAAAIVFK